MLERSHVESLLKLNGVDATAPDEEIKSVLISARWHKDDVETALLVLRENTKNHESRVDSLRKVFRTDEQLKPETISALLGIDVSVTRDALEGKTQKAKSSLSIGQVLQIGLVSLSASIVCLLASMWYLQIGMFHATLR